MHWNILDQQRTEILPLFKKLEGDFYLAGGTALALQLGHRDSIDFDFFTSHDINTEKLFEQLRNIFNGHDIIKTQDERNTLSVTVDQAIKISFMTYRYELLEPLIVTNYFNMASITDISCMKCSAITSRGAMKDYVDLYFILQNHSLSEILSWCTIKYPSIDTQLILKSLVYFDDLEDEEIIYKEQHDTDFEIIKMFLKKQVVIPL